LPACTDPDGAEHHHERAHEREFERSGRWLSDRRSHARLQKSVRIGRLDAAVNNFANDPNSDDDDCDNDIVTPRRHNMFAA
jgi:hypothetical protein